jgi:hypothetical protein
MLKYIYSIYRASVQAQHIRFCAISSSLPRKQLHATIYVGFDVFYAVRVASDSQHAVKGKQAVLPRTSCSFDSFA